MIQALIAHGHDFKAIGDYTERQIELFFGAIQRQQNTQKANQIEAVNLGFNGGADTTQYLKELRNLS